MTDAPPRRGMHDARPHTIRSLLAILLGATLLVACDASASAPVDGPADSTPNVATIPVREAVAGVEELERGFACAAPRPRADDYAWTCEGIRGPVSATVHIFAPSVDGDVFGFSLVTQPLAAGESDAAETATRKLGEDLIRLAVPEAWRAPAIAWIGDHMGEGGRTSNVPQAGITAGIQPLAGDQWYLELYELDGLER